jgi:hypothetical protein
MNKVYTGEGCMDLPAHADGTQITSCWEPSEEEMKVLWEALSKGEAPKIYLSILGNIQIPVWITAENPFILVGEGDNKHEE